jgi:hypothetical protein
MLEIVLTGASLWLGWIVGNGLREAVGGRRAVRRAIVQDRLRKYAALSDSLALQTTVKTGGEPR